MEKCTFSITEHRSVAHSLRRDPKRSAKKSLSLYTFRTIIKWDEGTQFKRIDNAKHNLAHMSNRRIIYAKVKSYNYL